MARLAGVLFVCLAFCASGTLAAPRLTARPNAEAAGTLPVGISKLADGAFVYSPTLDSNARPGVIVLFHGAGGDARRFIDLFRAEADRRQMLLLSVQSTGRTWDIVLDNSRDAWPGGRVRSVQAGGGDARHVNAALSALFRRTAIDPGRIIAAGFSDGASYALSLGLPNGHLFTGIVALAPGFVTETEIREQLPIAIAHGQSDQILSYARAQAMASDLRNRGYPVQFFPFAGDHMVDPGSLSKALDFVLSPMKGDKHL